MIRREGKEVIVVTYPNYVTKYVWAYFTHSFILVEGFCKTSYGAVEQLTTPILLHEIGFHLFEEDLCPLGTDPMDEKWALHLSRVLGSFLLDRMVWDNQYWKRWTVEWEADGLVRNAKEYMYECLRKAREERQ
jgi:hypothetical protein